MSVKEILPCQVDAVKSFRYSHKAAREASVGAMPNRRNAHNPLERALTRAGISPAELARRAGVARQNVDYWLRQPRLSVDAANLFAPHLAVAPSDLIFYETICPVVGYSRNWNVVLENAQTRVRMPPNGTKNTVAIQLQSESFYLKGWYAYFDDTRDPVSEKHIGQLCVVGLPDGRTLIRKVLRGAAEGRYHLLSATEDPIFDQVVEWASLITALLPEG